VESLPERLVLRQACGYIAASTSGSAVARTDEDRPKRFSLLCAKDDGAIAQLGERFNGIEEVVGSIPSGSTTHTRDLPDFSVSRNLPDISEAWVPSARRFA
jgi:hypothetical protein